MIYTIILNCSALILSIASGLGLLAAHSDFPYDLQNVDVAQAMKLRSMWKSKLRICALVCIIGAFVLFAALPIALYFASVKYLYINIIAVCILVVYGPIVFFLPDMLVKSIKI